MDCHFQTTAGGLGLALHLLHSGMPCEGAIRISVGALLYRQQFTINPGSETAPAAKTDPLPRPGGIVQTPIFFRVFALKRPEPSSRDVLLPDPRHQAIARLRRELTVAWQFGLQGAVLQRGAHDDRDPQ